MLFVNEKPDPSLNLDLFISAKFKMAAGH